MLLVSCDLYFLRTVSNLSCFSRSLMFLTLLPQIHTPAPVASLLRPSLTSTVTQRNAKPLPHPLTPNKKYLRTSICSRSQTFTQARSQTRAPGRQANTISLVLHHPSQVSTLSWQLPTPPDIGFRPPNIPPVLYHFSCCVHCRIVLSPHGHTYMLRKTALVENIRQVTCVALLMYSMLIHISLTCCVAPICVLTMLLCMCAVAVCCCHVAVCCCHVAVCCCHVAVC